MRATRDNPWAEAVLHMLAHVRAGADLAPSLWNPAWVEYCRAEIGPAERRTLAEDAKMLGALLGTHDAQANAQLVAWLFRDEDKLERARARELATLGPEDTDDPTLLGHVQSFLRQSVAPELVRAAAELEMPYLAELPSPSYDHDALERALDPLVAIAPALGGARIELARPLGIRGRVQNTRDGLRIWIGTPEARFDVSAEHAAWQAAHEATVHEVAVERARTHDDLEREAILRLRGRAGAAGLGEAHARWSARFRLPRGA